MGRLCADLSYMPMRQDRSPTFDKIIIEAPASCMKAVGKSPRTSLQPCTNPKGAGALC